MKQETIEETENESIIEEIVDLPTINNTEITVPLSESLENSESTSTTETFTVLDISTESTLNDTEISANVTDDLAEDTTVVDSTSDNDIDNSTFNATDSTDVDGEKTETFTEVINTEDVSELITDATELNTEEITVNITETPTPTVTEAESTTTTTTELPTTPIDILCPQIPETDIDPKYRNETFDLYLEEFMKKNPLAKIYKSPGFPAPYAENLNCTFRFVEASFLAIYFENKLFY